MFILGLRYLEIERIWAADELLNVMRQFDLTEFNIVIMELVDIGCWIYAYFMMKSNIDSCMLEQGVLMQLRSAGLGIMLVIIGACSFLSLVR